MAREGYSSCGQNGWRACISAGCTAAQGRVVGFFARDLDLLQDGSTTAFCASSWRA
jgi:hypothetical protein